MISGTIGYIKLRNNKQEFIFFLDNHYDETYCNDKVFVHNVFDKIYKDYNLYVEEPILEKNLNLMFSAPHVTEYLEYIKTVRHIPFDLRFDIDRIDVFSLFRKLILQLHPKYYYISIKHLKIIENLIRSKVGGSTFSIYQPFILEKANSDVVLDVITEFFLILLLLLSNEENNIIYCGASHSIVVSRLLSRYYGFTIIHDLNIEFKDTLKYEVLDTLPNCVNLSQIIMKP